MSKRKRKYENIPAMGNEAETPQEDQVVQEQEFQENQEVAQVFYIEESARSLISGYKPRWLASIKAYATSHGYKETATAEEWKQLFLSWGAKLS